MSHKRTLPRRKLVVIFLILTTLLGAANYFVSYGLVIGYVFHTKTGARETTDGILRFYRPLFRGLPSSVMCRYSEICGLTDVEAFFLVQAMEADWSGRSESPASVMWWNSSSPDTPKILGHVAMAPDRSSCVTDPSISDCYRTVMFADNPIPLRLKPSRQFPFLARHPWVHAHALAEDGRELTCGEIVDLLDHDGNWIARGVINPGSRLRIRLYGFDAGIVIGEELWRGRIDQAIARRRLSGPLEPEGAERLVFSESDLLSGLIVDRYADCLGVQFTFGGLLRWRDQILEHLTSSFSARATMIRIDEKTAKYESISAIHDWYQEKSPGGPIAYQSGGLMLSVDLQSGQKTGGYLDQQKNHAVAARYLKGRRVLDVCCYTGGFGLVAAKNGATSVIGIDSSQTALDEATQAAQRNGLQNISFQKEDCFDALKRLSQSGQQFDAVVLDPPRFAGSRHQIDSALRAYRRLNTLAVDLLPPGGILVTCSCSGRVSRADFVAMLAEVAKRRRRDLVLLENRGRADHPVSVCCPETDYLKCLVTQVG